MCRACVAARKATGLFGAKDMRQNTKGECIESLQRSALNPVLSSLVRGQVLKPSKLYCCFLSSCFLLVLRWAMEWKTQKGEMQKIRTKNIMHMIPGINLQSLSGWVCMV